MDSQPKVTTAADIRRAVSDQRAKLLNSESDLTPGEAHAAAVSYVAMQMREG